MKIKTLNLKGWAVFDENIKSIEFGDNLNVVYGLNEAGKSTIRRAISEILFGFSYKNCYMYPYAVNGCNNLSLTGNVENNSKIYHVERGLSNRENSIQIHNHTMLDISDMPISILQDVSLELYKGIFEMELSDLLPLSSGQWDIINKHISLQYGIGLVNSPKQLLSDLNSEMHTIWREHNRGNFEIKSIDAKLQKLYEKKNKLITQKDDFQIEKIGFSDLKFEHNQINEKIERLKSIKQYYHDNWRIWNILREIQTLENQLSDIKLPEIDMTKREYFELKSDIETEIEIKNQLDSKISQLKNNLDTENISSNDPIDKKFEIYKKEIQEQKKREDDLVRWQNDISKDVNKIAKTTWFESIKDWEDLKIEILEKKMAHREKIKSKSNIIYLILGVILLGASIYYLDVPRLWVGISISVLFIGIYFIKKIKKNKMKDLSYNSIVFFELEDIIHPIDEVEFYIHCQDISQRTKAFVKQSETVVVYNERINKIKDTLNSKNSDDNSKEKLRNMIANSVSLKYKLQKKLKKYELVKSKLLSIAEVEDEGFDILDEYDKNLRKLEELVSKKNKFKIEQADVQKLELINDLHNEMRTLDEQIDVAINQREKIKVEMARMPILEKQLSFDERHSNILLEIENMKASRQVAIKKYNSLKMMYELITYTDSRFYAMYEPVMFDVASKWLSGFTLGKYSKIVAGENRELMIFNSQINKYVEVNSSLSKGTLEQVYMAMRLSLANMIESDDIVMPIVLDEVFVNWDEERFFGTCDTIFKQNDRQIFYFTCHEDIATILESKYRACRINL